MVTRESWQRRNCRMDHISKLHSSPKCTLRPSADSEDSFELRLKNLLEFAAPSLSRVAPFVTYQKHGSYGRPDLLS